MQKESLERSIMLKKIVGEEVAATATHGGGISDGEIGVCRGGIETAKNGEDK